MLPMLVIKRRMSTIKLGKGDNVCQRPPNITRLFKNKNSKNTTYIMAQSGCRSRTVRMPKMMASQPQGVNTPKYCRNNLQNYRTMEWLISWKNTSPTIIKQKPPMSFAIINNLLDPSIRAIDFKISPWITITTTWNNFENHEDGSSGVKHPKRCSYTIP